MTAQRAYKYRIYPDREQETLFHKTFGCCRFLYNHMLADRMDMYEKTGKMKRLTPAGYKKEYPWLKEVDSLALANVQLHLEAAYRRYFSAEKAEHPKFKSKHRSRKSYTTNVVNRNIRFEEGKLRLPKAGLVRIRLHREPPEGYILKSVTVSMEPSGKYYASLLYEPPASENQTARKNAVDAEHPQEARGPEVLGIDFAMRGMAVAISFRRLAPSGLGPLASVLPVDGHLVPVGLRLPDEHACRTGVPCSPWRIKRGGS